MSLKINILHNHNQPVPRTITFETVMSHHNFQCKITLDHRGFHESISDRSLENLGRLVRRSVHLNYMFTYVLT